MIKKKFWHKEAFHYFFLIQTVGISNSTEITIEKEIVIAYRARKVQLLL